MSDFGIKRLSEVVSKSTPREVEEIDHEELVAKATALWEERQAKKSRHGSK